MSARCLDDDPSPPGWVINHPAFFFWLKWVAAALVGWPLALLAGQCASITCIGWIILVLLYWWTIKPDAYGPHWWALLLGATYLVTGVLVAISRATSDAIDAMGIVWFAAGFGAGVGLLQWSVLRRQIVHDRRWIWMSSISWFIAALVIVISVRLLPQNELALAPPLGLMAGGSISALMQWRLLRTTANGGGVWPIATVLTWGAAALIMWRLLIPLLGFVERIRSESTAILEQEITEGELWLFILSVVVTYFIPPILYATVSGIVLVRSFDFPRPQLVDESDELETPTLGLEGEIGEMTATIEEDKVIILFLAANPIDTVQLRLDEEVRAIDDALQRTRYRDEFELIQHWAVRVSDLQEHLLRHRPDIVHFCGHGGTSSELILENTHGEAQPVSARALKNLFSVLGNNIRCIVLNACYSESQARVIAEHIDCVIGMSGSIGDTSAISFATSFYRALAYGRSVEEAFRLGQNQIDLESLGEEDVPQLLAVKVDPAEIILAKEDSTNIPRFDGTDEIEAPTHSPDRETGAPWFPPELHRQIQSALLESEITDSDQKLRAFFAHPAILPWRHGLVNTNSPIERANSVLDYLLDNRNMDNESALVLFLEALRDSYDRTDGRRQEVEITLKELRRYDRRQQ